MSTTRATAGRASPFVAKPSPAASAGGPLLRRPYGGRVRSVRRRRASALPCNERYRRHSVKNGALRDARRRRGPPVAGAPLRRSDVRPSTGSGSRLRVRTSRRRGGSRVTGSPVSGDCHSRGCRVLGECVVAVRSARWHRLQLADRLLLPPRSDGRVYRADRGPTHHTCSSVVRRNKRLSHFGTACPALYVTGEWRNRQCPDITR